MDMRNNPVTRKIVFAALMAALCYIGFAVFRIDIPVGTEKTAFHLGNVFCVLAALLLAVGITATSVISAILVGTLIGFVSLSLLVSACLVRCLTACGD